MQHSLILILSKSHINYFFTPHLTIAIIIIINP